MKSPFRFLLSAAACFWTLSVSGQSRAADISGEYRIVEASRPGNGGSYGGKLTITAQGPSFQFDWQLDAGDTYSGPALMQNGVVGVGYGNGLTGLAVYEIKGKTLRAKWLLPATPTQVGEYELSGPSTLNGFYKFTNGVSGGITIKPHGKVYDMFWTLPTGSFAGIGIKMDNTLVAVSGTPGTPYGVAAYHRVGERVEGLWTVAGQTALGTETIVPASGSAPAPATAAAAAIAPTPAPSEPSTPTGKTAGFNAAGAELSLAGEIYHLQHNVSAPGQPTSELREYLRAGETFEHSAKMVSLRLQDSSGADPLTFSHVVLDHVKKEYPTAPTDEIGHTNDSATFQFLLTSGTEGEYNLWHYFRTPQGLASVQVVLRNQPPFENKDKFMAEIKAHRDLWIRDAKSLAPQVIAALHDSAKPTEGSAPAAPPPTAKPAEMSNDALADRIQADMNVAGGIAGNFLQLIQANKLGEATALISDEGLARLNTTRKDFLAKLQQIQRADGKLLSFTPDTSKPDFGPEEGGIYFVLAADSKYEKTAARETLRFFRFSSDGKIKMVGYQHSKSSTGQ